MTRKLINFDEAMAETRKRFSKIPPSQRPKKDKREMRPRTDAEKRAIVRSVARTVKNAEKSGLIVKTEKGFKMKW